MAEKRSSWGLFLSFTPLEPFVPQGVACPQLCLNLGSDDVSRTPFLLQLKSWEAECSGSLSHPVSCLVRLALGVSDQGPLTLMGVRTRGHPRKRSAGVPGLESRVSI